MQQDDFAKQDAERQHIETEKERTVLERNRGYTALVWCGVAAAVLLLGMLLWALWSWKNANNIAGRASASIVGTMDNLNSAAGHINAVAGNLEEFTNQIKDAPNQYKAKITQQLDDLHQNQVALHSELVSLRNMTDGIGGEAQHQLKQNGDAAKDLIARTSDSLNGRDGVPGLIPTLTASGGHIDDVAIALKAAANKLPVAIDDLDGSLKGLNTLEIDLDGTVKRTSDLIGVRIVDKNGFVTGTGLTGIVENINGVSYDARLKAHHLFFPDPCGMNKRGFAKFWDCTKEKAMYIPRIVYEGTRMYLQFTSLPVHLTGPIPSK